MEANPKGRRAFLGLIAKAVPALAGAALLVRYLLPAGRSQSRIITLEDSEIPGRGALVLPERSLAVLRTSRDVLALDLTCTHLGCSLNLTPSHISCPCHGSRFDLRGRVLQGPADRRLLRLEVRRAGSKLEIVDTRQA
jgi:Rieske Fe-S protein